MEKSHTEILTELEQELAALKERISALEDRIEELKAAAPEADVDFTEVEIGVVEPDEEVQEVIIPEPEPEPVPVSVPEPEPEPVVEPEPEPEPVRPVPKPSAKTAFQAWRTDKPGAPVKNIRSGISLYDRALFIGTLFNEDNALYDSTISALNGMESLEEAVQYLEAQFPLWDFGSDPVYTFMMAIRKKLS